MKENRVVIASDHAGFNLKQDIIDYINRHKLFHNVVDLGTHNADCAVDYADYANILCRYLLEHDGVGILICGTGIGMSIAANRYNGIRAALCTSVEITEQARAHVNANVLVLGSRFIDKEHAYLIVHKFFTTPFQAGRHLARIQKII